MHSPSSESEEEAMWGISLSWVTASALAIVVIALFGRQMLVESYVKHMPARQLFTILERSSVETRKQYQLIDVREPAELEEFSLTDLGAMNWPLSAKHSWTVGSLNRSLPVVCICARGRRSLIAASYLCKTFLRVFVVLSRALSVCCL